MLSWLDYYQKKSICSNNFAHFVIKIFSFGLYHFLAS